MLNNERMPSIFDFMRAALAASSDVGASVIVTGAGDEIVENRLGLFSDDTSLAAES